MIKITNILEARKEIWKLYNSGFTIKQIGDILQLDRHTISKYIKQGNKCKKST